MAQILSQCQMILIQSALTYPCEECCSKWEGLRINLKLLFNPLQMNIFATIFYLQSSSGLFHYYSETTTSLTYKKKLFHLFFPQTHWGTSCHRTWPAQTQTDTSCRKGVSAMSKILFWAEWFTWLHLTHKKANNPSFLGWKTSLVKILLQSWKYIAQQQKNIGFILNKNCWGSRAVREGLLSILLHTAFRSRPEKSQPAKIPIFISMALLVLGTNLQQSYSLLNSSGDLLWTVFTAIQVSNRVAIVSSSSSLT